MEHGDGIRLQAREVGLVYKVLFLTDDLEDYMADGLLYGLKMNTSFEVVDFPKKEILYENCDPGLIASTVRGGGFTLYGMLKDDEKTRVGIKKKLEDRWFDCVIFSNVWRQAGLLSDYSDWIKSTKVILLDGDDDNRFYLHTASKRFSRSSWNVLKLIARSNDVYYVKRELTIDVKRRIEATCGRSIKVLAGSFSIPSTKVEEGVGIRTQILAKHVVDDDVADVFKMRSRFYFSSEMEYQLDLDLSRFGVTTKRGGWDCLRHYELASRGCILCFRDLEKKPLLTAPHNLSILNTVPYMDGRSLKEQLEKIDRVEEERLRKETYRWVKTMTCEAVAQRLMLSVNEILR